MQKIPLELAKAGMMIEKPVLRSDGLVLIPQGAELTDALIERLQNMDIPSVFVKGQPLSSDGTSGPSISQKRLERLDHLFRAHSDEWMLSVKKFFRNYYMTRAAMETAQQPTGSTGEGS